MCSKFQLIICRQATKNPIDNYRVKRVFKSFNTVIKDSDFLNKLSIHLSINTPNYLIITREV